MRNEVKSGESNGYRGWLIKDTPCYPCRYKVFRKGFREDNATWRYHRTVSDAKKTINRFEDNAKVDAPSGATAERR